MDWESLDRNSRGCETVHAMSKEARQCIKCGRWFYDSIFYPEGRYDCRWHDCDRIDHVSRRASIYEDQSGLIERFLKWLRPT
jgi:hypothetical protein